MSDSRDLFFLDKIFPEASKIFSEQFKTVNEILKDALVVLDTNVLLVPFDTTEKNASDIGAIYHKYKSQNRLFIPARVAREFANNRATKIADVFLQIRQLKDNLNTGNFKINQYPILHANPDYNELLKQFEMIQKSIKASRKLLENIEAHIQGWNWNDNVSHVYKEIFTEDIIVEVKKSKDDLQKDLAFRIEYKVAPGFKDSRKPDDGIGDLIIWQTVLELAKEKNKDIIFVTNDQKNDWFYKQDKIGLYPKYELFDEFRRFTNGRSISIINFVRFLELSNAKEETIKEVKTTIEESKPNDFKTGLSLIKGLQVEHRKFGKGRVMELRKSGPNTIADIMFPEFGLKSLLVEFAPLKILDTALNFLTLNPDFDGDEKTYQFKNLDE